MKIKEALAWAERSLREAGVPSPKRESELLLSSLLNKDVSYIMLHPDDELSEDKTYRMWVARRCCREPIQYILGEVEFLGLKFKIENGIFIPRPETEILVEEVLRFIGCGRVIDLGTGCGNIILSLLSRSRDLWGIGVDVSNKAIEIARENARRLGLVERVLFINCDWGESLVGWFEFDLIVSNPPYIPRNELWTLEPEVLLYEPKEALDGGADGREFYLRSLEFARRCLRKGGILALELGKAEYKDLFSFLDDFSVLSIRKDYNGLERVIVLQRDRW